ncbi:alpha/beta hydrolase [Candidatus Uhrbacteria bacterium]|nr:alpha/beta hydrolase [Candidatus Uhrbacteria bacterium]
MNILNNNMSKSTGSNVLIIHGADGNPEENWFAWLKTELEKLGCTVFVPQMPIDENQTLQGWLKAFQFYEERLNENTILVGHSLGAAFLLRLLEKKKAKAAFLIAGMHCLPNNQFDSIIKSFVNGGFDWPAIKSNCVEFQILQGDDDPYIDKKIAFDLATKLDTHTEFINGAGHFNEASGYTKFPLLLEKIKLLISLDMTLSTYHQEYSAKDNEEIQRRADEKERELVSIFESAKLNTGSEPIKVAVFGCGDKRFISHHKRIFKNILNKQVEVTTFDITIDHLSGEANVFQHDCTLPIPNTPYDITYAHVLMKFIDPQKQFNLLKNSFDALKIGGIAIHVFDKEEIETSRKKLSNGLWPVNLKQLKQKLTALDIDFLEVTLKYGLALVILKS